MKELTLVMEACMLQLTLANFGNSYGVAVTIVVDGKTHL